MYNIIVLHGTMDNSQSNWFPWFKSKMDFRHKVWIPDLPGSNKPDPRKYTEFLLKNADRLYDERTVVIGHSSGAVEVLYLLQHMPEHIRIKAGILIGVFKDRVPKSLQWDALTDMFPEEFDFEKIKKHAEKIVYIHSDNDPYCPLEHAEYLMKHTGGELKLFKGYGHFSLSSGIQFSQFPEILDIIDSL
ncbi:MAG: alpha/beta fold hydrolase [Candidatus Roizmanbacteria bacterium]